MGVNQKSQSGSNGFPPLKKTCDFGRAELKKVFVMGMLKKCIKVNANLIAIKTNLTLNNLSVATNINKAKNVFKVNSVTKVASIE
jgi:hypothetical protein